MRTTILAAILCAAGAAHADDNQLTLGGGARTLRSASADAVTSDSLETGAVSYARGFGEVGAPGLALWLEAAYSWGSASGTMFQTMGTHVGTDVFLLGAHAHYPLHRLIDAIARVDLGTARTSLSISDGTTTLSDSGWGAVAQGALGFDCYASRTRAFGLGLRVELGYTEAAGVALTPHMDSGGDTLKLKTASASVGHLDLSGALLAASLIGSF